MPILGLLSTESFSDERFTNIRRKVFRQYPNGAAPLIGILSLMKDEVTNDPKFSHYEKRLVEQRTETQAAPFLTSAGAAGADPISLVANTEYQLLVDSTSLFRVGHVFRMVADTASSTVEVKGVVTEVVDSTHLKFRALVASAGIINTAATDNADKEVTVIGSAFKEGIVDSSSGIYHSPTNHYNYTQIFRRPFRITGTALKTPVKYDDTGAYKEQAKDASLDHMIEMELAFLFGERTEYVDTSDDLPTRTTGGILYHLQRWEAGDYRSVTASSDSDDDKRIITNSGGTMSEEQYDSYLERLFRYTSNTSNEKLVLCGSGFLKTINQMYKHKSVLNADMPQQDTYGMAIVKHLTSFGTVFYKTHPLFNRNATLRNNALFLDVHNLRYRPMLGRDTELLKNRQPNDADYRKDEWLTEAGFEMYEPETCMYLQNVTSYAP